ncbi:MAG: SDR family oxidoreductase [bacterium]
MHSPTPFKKDLLIVGCGYLGMRVLRLASDHAWKVFGTSRKIEKKTIIESAGAEFIDFDITRPETCQNLPSVSTWLWCPAFDRSQGLSVQEVVADGLIRSLKLAPTKPDRLIFVSTTSVFHQSDGQWVDELSPTNPVTGSGMAHLNAEQLLTTWASSTNTSAITIRLSGLYGPGRWIRRASIEKGEPIACDPETYLNLLHIDDAMTGCLAALNHSTSSGHQLFCLTDDLPINSGEFYQTSARLLNAPQPSFISTDQNDFSGNKKVRNQKFKSAFNWKPRYPVITTGLKSILASEFTK